jgi:hypothetical protein
MPRTSPVFASFIFSSLILHHRLFGTFFRLRTISLTEFRGDALPFALPGESLESDFRDGVAVSVSDARDGDSFDVIESLAERATDRILLVSGSRGVDIGPKPLAVAVLLFVEVGGDAESGLRVDSPERLPLE